MKWQQGSDLIACTFCGGKLHVRMPAWRANSTAEYWQPWACKTAVFVGGTTAAAARTIHSVSSQVQSVVPHLAKSQMHFVSDRQPSRDGRRTHKPARMASGGKLSTRYRDRTGVVLLSDAVRRLAGAGHEQLAQHVSRRVLLDLRGRLATAIPAWMMSHTGSLDVSCQAACTEFQRFVAAHAFESSPEGRWTGAALHASHDFNCRN